MNTDELSTKKEAEALNKHNVSGSAINLMIIMLWMMWFLCAGGLNLLLGDDFIIRCILILPFTMLTLYISKMLWHYR